MTRNRWIGTALVLLLAGCSPTGAEQPQEGHGMNHGKMGHSGGQMEGQMNHHTGQMVGHMDHDNIAPLQNSEGTQELAIPPILQKQEDKDFDYEVVAEEGTVEFFDGQATATFGYNGNLLGPTLRLQEGETVNVKVRNALSEPTTFHWHGLEIPGSADGGPHQEIKPGESKIVTLQANQPAATLWYHPHPHKATARQVFKGLAGMLYIDPSEESMGLPADYGVNDIPLIFQDRLFNADHQLAYDQLMNSDGTIGDISLVNGTLNPKLTVAKPLMRFRILNGANARNYTFSLSNGASFTQIASDGGMLNKPAEMDKLTLSPSERAEILIDFSKMGDEPVSIVDSHGSVLLPFELKLQDKAASHSAQTGSGTPFVTNEEKSLPVTKNIELFGMMEHVTINGKKFDPGRIDLTQKKGVPEVWEVHNKPDMMGGMIHPFHIHGTQFKVISRDGKETPVNEQGLKDSVLIEPGERVRLLVAFPEEGIYMYHCHILEHEDNGMMGQIEVTR